MMTFKISGENREENIRELFWMFDQENKDFLTVDDIRAVAIELGEDLDDNELSNMI